MDEAMNEQVSWPPRSSVTISTWQVEDLAAGDLVFSSKAPRADKIEILNQIAGEQWRHVAAVFKRAGELFVAEIDKNSFGYRPLSTFMSSFDRYGAARLGLEPACVDQATAWMKGKIDSQHIYAWDDMFIAGVLSLTTRGIFVGNRARVRAALHAAIDAAKEGQKSGAADSFTCSSFIQRAYGQAAGPCGIVHERWRRGVSWPTRLESIDALLSDDGTHLDDAFGQASLLELYDVISASDRDGEWKPNADHWRERIRVLLSAIGGYVHGDAPDRLETDGRWVTPTDIWHSPSISARGYLPRSTR